MGRPQGSDSTAAPGPQSPNLQLGKAKTPMANSASTLAGDENRVPSEFNCLAMNAAILEVLCDHGFSPRLEDVTVTPIMQGDRVAGVSISASVYERPADLGPVMTREEYDAWLGSAFNDLASNLDNEGDADAEKVAAK